MAIDVKKEKYIGWLVGLIVLIGVGLTCQGATPVEVVLAADGQAKQQVVVAESASRAINQTAKVLADYLGKIAGAPFSVTIGDGTTGIAVGTVHDFPALPCEAVAAGSGYSANERYCIRTRAAGVYLIGASDLAVQHAVWDLLHQLGYRQYFPTSTWEIVPHRPDLTATLDVLTQPDYAGRPWTLWTANDALATEAGDEPVRWMVRQP